MAGTFFTTLYLFSFLMGCFRKGSENKPNLPDLGNASVGKEENGKAWRFQAFSFLYTLVKIK